MPIITAPPTARSRISTRAAPSEVRPRKSIMTASFPIADGQ